MVDELQMDLDQVVRLEVCAATDLDTLGQVLRYHSELCFSDPDSSIASALSRVAGELEIGVTSSPLCTALLTTSTTHWALVPAFHSLPSPPTEESAETFLVQVFSQWNRFCEQFDLLQFLSVLVDINHQKHWQDLLSSLFTLLANEMLLDPNQYHYFNGDKFDLYQFLDRIREQQLRHISSDCSDDLLSEAAKCEISIQTAMETNNPYCVDIADLKLGLYYTVTDKCEEAWSCFSGLTERGRTLRIKRIAAFCRGVVAGARRTEEEMMIAYYEVVSDDLESDFLQCKCKIELLGTTDEKWSDKEQKLRLYCAELQKWRFADLAVASTKYKIAQGLVKNKFYTAAAELISECLEEGHPPLTHCELPVVAALLSLRARLLRCAPQEMLESMQKAASLYFSLSQGEEWAKEVKKIVLHHSNSKDHAAAVQCWEEALRSLQGQVSAREGAELTAEGMAVREQGAELTAKVLAVGARACAFSDDTQRAKAICETVIRYYDKQNAPIAYIHWKVEANKKLAELCYIECVAIRRYLQQWKKLLKAYNSLATLYSAAKPQPPDYFLEMLREAIALSEEQFPESRYPFLFHTTAAEQYAKIGQWEETYRHCQSARRREHFASKDDRQRNKRTLLAACEHLELSKEADVYRLELSHAESHQSSRIVIID